MIDSTQENQADVMRSTYRALTEGEKKAMNDIKFDATRIHTKLKAMQADAATVEQRRCLALAATKCEEMVMWATKAITA